MKRGRTFLGGTLDLTGWVFTGHEKFDEIIGTNVQEAFKDTFEEEGPFIQLVVDGDDLAIKVSLIFFNDREPPEWIEAFSSVFDHEMVDDEDIVTVRDKLLAFVSQLNERLGE
jgi:hypothetical protein